MQATPHVTPVSSRREFLLRGGGGFGALALTYLLSRDATASASVQPPHVAPRAKSVIWLFMEGGPSHLDLFDRKPTLQKLAGQPMPASFGKVITSMGTAGNTLLPSKRSWKRHGKSGLWVSDWYNKVAEHADDLCVIHSCWEIGRASCRERGLIAV